MNNLDTKKCWQDYRELICRAWAKNVMAVLDLARICAEADANLETDDYLRLESALPFGKAKMSMLRQIGGDGRLYEKHVLVRLPPSYSIIYQVHLLNDDELKSAMESGLLRPDVRRDQIEQLRLKRGYSKLRAQPTAVVAQDSVQACSTGAVEVEQETEFVVFGELLVPRYFKRLSSLHDALLHLVASYGIEFVPRPGLEARRVLEYEEKSAAHRRFLVYLDKDRRAQSAA